MKLDSCQNFEDAFCLHLYRRSLYSENKDCKKWSWEYHPYWRRGSLWWQNTLLSVSVSFVSRPKALISVIALSPPPPYKQRRANELALDVLILSCPLNSECTDFNLKRFVVDDVITSTVLFPSSNCNLNNFSTPVFLSNTYVAGVNHPLLHHPLKNI